MCFMMMDASWCLLLVVISGLSAKAQTEVNGNGITSDVSVLVPDGRGPGSVYLLTEGCVLHVCCDREEFFGGLDNGRETMEIVVYLEGESSEDVDVDFHNRTSTITAGNNCTSISTVDDVNYERNKVFTVTVAPRESDDKEIGLSYSVVLQDNDGPDIACSETFAQNRNITDVLVQRGSCLSPADIPECPVEDTDQLVDCTRWDVDSASQIPTSDELFPIINSAPCVTALRDLLAASYSTVESEEQSDLNSDPPECFTNCTATLLDGCFVSVLLLENVNARRFSDLVLDGMQIPQECGVYNITCCTETFPEQCFGQEELPAGSGGEAAGSSDSLVGPIVGGVVGGVVGLSLLIVAGVVVGVLVCMAHRKKQQEQWKRNPSTLVQSIVYKPKTNEDSTAVSRTSTMASSTPLTLENGRGGLHSSPPTQPNYEVTYNDSYSTWKKRFTKIIIDAKDLEYGEVIGEGEFSMVFQAEYTAPKAPVKQVAVKNLKNVTEHEEIEKFIKESAIMLDFDHRNILHLVGVCFNTGDNLPAIVLPYMSNGDLRTFLKKRRAEMEMSKHKRAYPEGLSEAVLLGMCMDVAKGMHYLSKCKFVHRDLAARNCMVDKNMVVKVADFGLSRDIHVSDYYRLKHRQKLPVKWMAPESLFTKIYNQKTDVWSFGIVCWEIFKFGKKPYAGIENPDLPSYISHGFRPKKPSRAPDELFKLMQQIWLEDPQERPDFRAIVLHLANLTKYEGDIEKDLEAETKSCSKLRVKPYQQVDIPRLDKDPSLAHVYSTLEQPEPVYSNFSREASPGSLTPEEYEVPAKQDSLTAEEYEVPSQHLQDGEDGASVDDVPVDYEVPQSTAERKKKSRPKPEVNRPKPEVPLRNSPAHVRKPPASSPVIVPPSDKTPADEEEILYEVPSTLSQEAVPTRYSRLSYPAVQKAMSAPDPNYEVAMAESPYKNLGPHNCNSLPSSFLHKNHVYQTLEPNA